ncbi:hypothetical protein N7530_000141 [Penicillium desertorum]|uniref:NACHT domain-containing protein n=1 Tax=Penicillium desertorum TaxID=1303715 RepID=A0A9W9X862_9EURO|nr:hypothetical protein N7530_000141 [Penicillium desertorum]
MCGPRYDSVVLRSYLWQALITSAQRPERHLRDIIRWTRGIAFLGTPHHGAGLARWAELLSRSIGIIRRTNTEIVAVLKRESEVLARIQDSFHTMVMARTREGRQLIEITCFYEELPLAGVGQVVPQHSAVLPGYIPIGIHSNHMDMTKFASIDDPGFEAVCGELRRWIRQMDVANRDPRDPPALNHIESSRDRQDRQDGLGCSRVQLYIDSSNLSKATEVDNFVAPSMGSTVNNLGNFCRTPNHLTKVLQLLHTSDYEGYKEAIAPRTNGTCIWFLEDRLYLTWLKEVESSLLWVSGDPGCGKTVLANFLFETLKETLGSSTTLCYFFFDQKIETQSNASNFLAAILHQLFRKCPGLIEHAQESLETRNSQIGMRAKTLWDIFKTATEDPRGGNIICVVDALDECEGSSRGQFIEWISTYIEKRRISSDDIFKTAPHIRLKAEDYSELIDGDVVLFIKERSRAMQRVTGCSEATRAKVENHLVEKAGQTFLWVSLILELLTKTTNASEHAFNKILMTLPRRLDDIYDAILQRSTDPLELKRVLAVLIGSQRPLSLIEFNLALALRQNDYSMDDAQPRLQFDIFRRLKGVCGPFVKISNGRVYLIHQTAKEFLVRPPGAQERLLPCSWKHCLDPAWMHSVLAEICVWYLCFDVFAIPPSQCEDFERPSVADGAERYSQPHVLLDYASKYWSFHCRSSGEKTSDYIWDKACYLCDSQKGVFKTWFQLYWTTIATSWQYPANISSLMVASHLGLERLVHMLLASSFTNEVNEQDSAGWTAMHWAVWEGHGVSWDGNEAVKQLLVSGAHIDVQDGEGMTPLHWAAADGQNILIRLIMDAGANVHAADFDGWTALHLASVNGQEETVELLLDYGAEIDAGTIEE